MKNLATKGFALAALTMTSWVFGHVSGAFSITTLNQTLDKTKARWKASENWLTHSSPEELKNIFSTPVEALTLTENIQTTEPVSDLSFEDKLPTLTWDWRHQNQFNYVSPILNQGHCGSCVAFAAIGVLETQLNIESNIPQLNNRFSTEKYFACGGGSCDSGSFPASMIRYLSSDGAINEACAPQKMAFTGVTPLCRSVVDQCSSLALPPQKIQSAPTYSTLSEMKTALKKGPLFVTMNVYEDFIFYSSGVYSHISGKLLGGHALSVVGFDDTKGAWIIRNSWGETWGEKGFGYVSYNDRSGISKSGRLFKMEPPAIYIQIPMQDRAYLSKETTFAISIAPTEAIAASEPVEISIRDEMMNVLKANTCKPNELCLVNVSPDALGEGKFFLIAEGRFPNQATGPAVASSVKHFYVTGPEIHPKLSIRPQFSPEHATGTAQLVVDAKTGSKVPFEKVAFIVKDSDGKIVREAWNEPNVETLHISWRTNGVKNGRYFISAKAVYPQKEGLAEFQSEPLAVQVEN